MRQEAHKGCLPHGIYLWTALFFFPPLKTLVNFFSTFCSGKLNECLPLSLDTWSMIFKFCQYQQFYLVNQFTAVFRLSSSCDVFSWSVFCLFFSPLSCCFAVFMYRFYIDWLVIITHLWKNRLTTRWKEWMRSWTGTVQTLIWAYCLKHPLIKSLPLPWRNIFPQSSSLPPDFFLRETFHKEDIISSFWKIMNCIIHTQK